MVKRKTRTLKCRSCITIARINRLACYCVLFEQRNVSTIGDKTTSMVSSLNLTDLFALFSDEIIVL